MHIVSRVRREHASAAGDVDAGQQPAPAALGVPAADVGDGDGQEGCHEEQVRRRVGEEQLRRGGAEEGEQRGQRRAEHPAGVHHHRVEAHRTGQVSAVDEQGHAGLEGRGVEGVADPDDERRGEQRPQRGGRRHQHGEDDAEGHLDQLHDDQVRAPREAVGEHAGGDREQQQRTELREHEQADQRRRVGAVLHVGRQGEVLHPRPDAGQEQTEPDQPEVAVGERRPGGPGPMGVGEADRGHGRRRRVT